MIEPCGRWIKIPDNIIMQRSSEAIGKSKKPKQQPLWIAATDLAPRSGHPFYTRLNQLLEEDGF